MAASLLFREQQFNQIGPLPGRYQGPLVSPGRGSERREA